MFKERKRARYRRRRLQVMSYWVLATILLCGGIYSFFAVRRHNMPIVKVQVKNYTMIQDEQVPQFELDVTCSRSKDRKLDQNYLVKDLITDFKNQKGLKLECKVNPDQEGTYPIKAVLSESFEKKLAKKWKSKVKVQIDDGQLVVENKLGVWDGEQFKRHDGSYVQSSFVPSKGNRYYFDENGKLAKGWKDIDHFRYFFDKQGVMATGWQELDGQKYYFDREGKMSVGWTQIDDATYFFDKEGHMLTGSQRVFQMSCEFGADGKLISKESSVDTTKPMVALTFDDGPAKYTDAILNKLEEYGARATFFMLGINAKRFPEEIKRMEELGCDIGNHSKDHADLAKLDEAAIKEQLGTTDSAIAAAIGHDSTMVRPPYGSSNDLVRSLIGKPIIMWSLDTEDWKKKNEDLIYNYVMENVKDGDIILLHDIHEFSANATLKLIPELIHQGYQLVTVTELAEARGVQMQNGERYFDFRK